MTFARVITEWADCNTQNSPDPFHVISIGDSTQEREAIFRVHKHHRVKFIPKSVKFPERLSVDELVIQHNHLARHIESVVRCDKSLDISLESTGEYIDHPITCAPLLAIKTIHLPYMRPQSTDSSRRRSSRAPKVFPRRRPRSRVPDFFPHPPQVSLLVRASSSPRI